MSFENSAPTSCSKGNCMPTRLLGTLTIATVFLLIATPADAGRRIVTPSLFPKADGFVSCRVNNASASKTIDIEVSIYDLNGNITEGPNAASLPPDRNFVINSSDNDARQCVVEVMKGGKKNVRVSLSILDASAQTIAAVSGY